MGIEHDMMRYRNTHSNAKHREAAMTACQQAVFRFVASAKVKRARTKVQNVPTIRRNVGVYSHFR